MRPGRSLPFSLAVAACWAASAGGPSFAQTPAAASQPSSRPSTQPGFALPEAAFEDLVLLVKTARRAFQEKMEGLPERGALYRPASLSGAKAIVHLALRSHGGVLAEAESQEMEVLDAAVAAGARLAQTAAQKKLKIRDGGEELGLEFEWLGPREYIEAKYAEAGSWSDALLHSFEPAAEGIGVEFRGKRGWTRASQIVALNYTPDLALGAAESAIGLTHTDKLHFDKEIRYFRFRGYHLWQPSATAVPVLLARGAALVPPEAVDARSLDAAIARLGDYLHYRQNRDGWFSQEYQPTPDKYGEGNSALVQLRALHGLTAYAVWSGRTDLISDAKKGIAKDTLFLTPLSVVAGVSEQGQAQVAQAGLALVFPGHEDYLEISAELLLALLQVGQYWRADAPIWQNSTSRPTTATASAPFQTDITVGGCVTGLVQGLLASQDEDGRLEMVFTRRPADQPPDLGEAGWAILALARAYQSYAPHGGGAGAVQATPTSTAAASVTPTELAARIDRALQAATPYYQRLCKEAVDPQDAAVLARALASAYSCTNDSRVSDLAFGLLDEFARLQVSEASCPWPELYGAVNAREPGLVGADSADYLAALADGVVLAERIGDQERAKRYRGAVRSAARFILQLEVREEGCYYIRSPRDALGGVRTSPWDNRIRADHCAQALVGLMRAREVLYGPPR